MSGSRHEILAWMEQGRLPVEALPAAFRLAGLSPDREDWRNFIDRLMLWLGVVFCAAAVVFFFAYNWADMGKYAKFGLVEIMIIAGVALAWKLGPDRVAGHAALLFSSMLVGALLALVGQTYQTGADTYELFAVWALAIFPWVMLSRFASLWLFWIGLLNLAVLLYFQTFGVWFGVLFNTEAATWILFTLNTVALCTWEFCAHRGVDWLDRRWALRMLALASGSLITVLMVWNLVESGGNRYASLLIYPAWITAAWLVYRYRIRDVFVLAGGVLSVIVVITAFLAKTMLRHESAGAFLFIGLVVIGLSAVGGMWLKNVAKEDRT
ncbi:DUF2157 domain-containing protein [soil metagenome]